MNFSKMLLNASHSKAAFKNLQFSVRYVRYIVYVFMPRHSKNGGGAFIFTPVRPSVCPVSKFGVRSITFEILH